MGFQPTCADCRSIGMMVTTCYLFFLVFISLISQIYVSRERFYTNTHALAFRLLLFHYGRLSNQLGLSLVAQLFTGMDSAERLRLYPPSHGLSCHAPNVGCFGVVGHAQSRKDRRRSQALLPLHRVLWRLPLSWTTS